MINKLLQRLCGLPRTFRELDRSLALLAMLRSQGWHATAASGRPVNGGGDPVPWWTHGVADWLGPRLRRTDRVFEWGAGHSTLWFAQRVGVVISVEDKADFARAIREQATGATGSADVVVRTSAAYVSAISAYAYPFDLIVIDGIDRPACAAVAPAHLAEDGLILYDNSDRPEAAQALRALAQQQFLRVDWYGLVLGSHHGSVTSLLCRDPKRWFGGPLPPWCGY